MDSDILTLRQGGCEGIKCHGAAVGRLGRLHDYPFWMFPFLCLD